MKSALDRKQEATAAFRAGLELADGRGDLAVAGHCLRGLVPLTWERGVPGEAVELAKRAMEYAKIHTNS